MSLFRDQNGRAVATFSMTGILVAMTLLLTAGITLPAGVMC